MPSRPEEANASTRDPGRPGASRPMTRARVRRPTAVVMKPSRHQRRQRWTVRSLTGSDRRSRRNRCALRPSRNTGTRRMNDRKEHRSPAHRGPGKDPEDRHAACADTGRRATHRRTGSPSNGPPPPDPGRSRAEAQRSSHHKAAPDTTAFSPFVVEQRKETPPSGCRQGPGGRLPSTAGSVARPPTHRMITLREGDRLRNLEHRDQNRGPPPQIARRFSTRADYCDRVICCYLDAPDTPRKARPKDWAIAGQLRADRVPLDLIERAIALASFRRRLRPPDAEPLEPIRSLAYIWALVHHLRRTGVDDGYRAYVADRYEALRT